MLQCTYVHFKIFRSLEAEAMQITMQSEIFLSWPTPGPPRTPPPHSEHSGRASKNPGKGKGEVMGEEMLIRTRAYFYGGVSIVDGVSLDFAIRATPLADPTVGTR